MNALFAVVLRRAVFVRRAALVAVAAPLLSSFFGELAAAAATFPPWPSPEKEDALGEPRWCPDLARMEAGEWDYYGAIDGESFRAQLWPLLEHSHLRAEPELLVVCGAGAANWAYRQKLLPVEEKGLVFEQALPLVIKAAQLGHWVAMSEAAWMFQEGLGTPVDVNQALFWSSNATALCEQQLGPEHPATTRSLLQLADQLRDLERQTEADALYLRWLILSSPPGAPGPANPAPASEVPAEARLLLQEAEQLRQAHRFAEAERKYRAFLGQSPDQVGVLLRLGVCQLELDQTAAARASLQQLLQVDANVSTAYLLLGMIHQREGDSAGALPNLQRAFILDPQNAEILNWLGIVLSQTGKPGASEAALRHAVSLAPQFAAAHHNLAAAYCMGRPQQLEPARQHYRRARELGHPRNPQVEECLGGPIRDPQLESSQGARRIVSSGAKSTWSPDGRRLAYSRAPGEGIDILSLVTGQAAELTATGKDPAWSPDGRWIAYVKSVREAPGQSEYLSEQVWLIEASGGEPRFLLQAGFPSWSADSQVVYGHSRKSNEILAVAIAPGAAPTVFFGQCQSWYPAISPDASQIAFGALGKLVVLERATGVTMREWELPHSRGALPAWSPDGRWIAAGGFDDDYLGLWLFDTATGNQERIAAGPYTAPEWSRDGRRLAFDYRPADMREVWAMDSEQMLQGEGTEERGMADSASAEKKLQVERLGDPKRLVFEGNATFSTQALRSGLVKDPEFLLAAHPAAPLSDYVAAVQQSVRFGYQHAGFPNVEVQGVVDRNAQVIRVRVREGQRFTNGPVEIIGAKTVAADPLVRSLTSPYPPPERLRMDLSVAGSGTQPANGVQVRTWLDVGPGATERMAERSGMVQVDRITGKTVVPRPALWPVGEPTSFDPFAEGKILAGVTNALAELGRFFAKAEVAIFPDSHTGSARLRVNLLQEGQGAVVESIEISGNSKNTREALLSYLDLRPGMPLTTDLVPRTEERLLSAARFAPFQVQLEPIDSSSLKLQLKITLTEYTPAPPLSQEFSPEEKAMLKLGDWLSGIPLRGEDIRFSAADFIPRCTIELILSRRGLAAFVREHLPEPPDRAAEAGSSTHASPQQETRLHAGPMVYGFAISGTDGVFLSAAQKARLRFFRPAAGLVGLFGISSVPPSAESEDMINVQFGGSFSYKGEAPLDSSPLRLEIQIEPAAMIKSLRRPSARFSTEDGVSKLLFDENWRILAESSSGRLLEWTWSDGDVPRGAVQAGEGLFAAAWKEIESAAATCRDVSSPTAPLSALLRFAVADILQNPLFGRAVAEQPLEQRRRAVKAFNRLLDRPVLAPLEELLLRTVSGTNLGFRVPFDTANATQSTLTSALLAWVFSMANELFPERSWPWTAAHEAVFVTRGMAKYTDAELQRLYESRQTGPIGYLTLARLLAHIQSPTARPFAIRGLTRLSAENFRQDWQLVLQGDSVLAQVVQGFISALAELQEDEVQALAAVLPREAGRLLLHGARTVRENQGRPLPETVAPILERYWDESLRAVIQAQLREVLSQGSRQTAAR